LIVLVLPGRREVQPRKKGAQAQRSVLPTFGSPMTMTLNKNSFVSVALGGAASAIAPLAQNRVSLLWVAVSLE
jgi:hypothetical protein